MQENRHQHNPSWKKPSTVSPSLFLFYRQGKRARMCGHTLRVLKLAIWGKALICAYHFLAYYSPLWLISLTWHQLPVKFQYFNMSLFKLVPVHPWNQFHSLRKWGSLVIHRDLPRPPVRWSGGFCASFRTSFRTFLQGYILHRLLQLGRHTIWLYALAWIMDNDLHLWAWMHRRFKWDILNQKTDFVTLDKQEKSVHSS